MARILIVDDEKSIRMLYYFLLSDAGHTVVEAETGAQALLVLEDVVPDIILLDVAMPEMRGPEFAANLRAMARRRPELSGIPYFVMTGENYMGHGAEFGFEADPGFMGYIPKMTPPEEVLSRLETALRR